MHRRIGASATRSRPEEKGSKSAEIFHVSIHVSNQEVL